MRWGFGVLYCFFSLGAFGQGIEVMVEGRVTMGLELSYAKAQMLALKKARILAVEKAVGIHVSSSSLIIDDLMQASLINTHSQGFLTREELEWHVGAIPGPTPDKAPIPVVTAKLRATVVPTAKSFWRPYYLSAAIQGAKDYYRAGEKIKLNLKAHKDMYVIVANFHGQGDMHVLYPNFQRHKNLLRKEQALQLPSKRDRLKMVIEAPKDNIWSEAFIVIGVPVSQKTSKIDWVNFWPRAGFHYTGFYQRLLDLELDWISEQVLNYRVMPAAAEK